MGGKVLRDMPILNAFVADMQTKNVLLLGQAEGVRWVSLDLPAAFSTGGEKPAEIRSTRVVSAVLYSRPIRHVEIGRQDIIVNWLPASRDNTPSFRA